MQGHRISCSKLHYIEEQKRGTSAPFVKTAQLNLHSSSFAGRWPPHMLLLVRKM